MRIVLLSIRKSRFESSQGEIGKEVSIIININSF